MDTLISIGVSLFMLRCRKQERGWFATPVTICWVCNYRFDTAEMAWNRCCDIFGQYKSPIITIKYFWHTVTWPCFNLQTVLLRINIPTCIFVNGNFILLPHHLDRLMPSHTYALINYGIIGSENGLPPLQCQSFIRTNVTSLDNRSSLMKFQSKYNSFHTRICVWKCCLQMPDSICWYQLIEAEWRIYVSVGKLAIIE